jgi:hypothetical protein
MPRLVISLICGICIPTLLFMALLIAVPIFGPDSQVYWPWVWLINWPEYLLARYITLVNVIPIVVLSNFAAYSLLAYLVLRLRDRKRIPKLP